MQPKAVAASLPIVSDLSDQDVYDAVSQQYAVKVNDYVSDLIDKDDHKDVIARQYVPSANELITREDELSDPIGDEDFSPVKGIVHRYPDRVLLKITPACPVYCRYCFRKTMVGSQGDPLRTAELEAALSYIEETPDIWEVILTGGDPLTLSPRRLKGVMQRLDSIDHVQIVRIHTRSLASAPDVFDDKIIEALIGNKMRYLVAHINHVREITPAFISAAQRLRRAGVNLLSQSVLLKDVNDDAKILEDLFRGLVINGVKPYMLHHLDKAPGTAHFRVSLARGQEIMKQLRGRVSGLCLPEYMLDIPGGYGKVPLTPSYCETIKEVSGKYRVNDYLGEIHDYDD